MGHCCSKDDDGPFMVHPATDTFDADIVQKKSMEGMIDLGLLPYKKNNSAAPVYSGN